MRINPDLLGHELGAVSALHSSTWPPGQDGRAILRSIIQTVAWCLAWTRPAQISTSIKGGLLLLGVEAEETISSIKSRIGCFVSYFAAFEPSTSTSLFTISSGIPPT